MKNNKNNQWDNDLLGDILKLDAPIWLKRLTLARNAINLHEHANRRRQPTKHNISLTFSYGELPDEGLQSL